MIWKLIFRVRKTAGNLSNLFLLQWYFNVIEPSIDQNLVSDRHQRVNFYIGLIDFRIESRNLLVNLTHTRLVLISGLWLSPQFFLKQKLIIFAKFECKITFASARFWWSSVSSFWHWVISSRAFVSAAFSRSSSSVSFWIESFHFLTLIFVSWDWDFIHQKWDKFLQTCSYSKRLISLECWFSNSSRRFEFSCCLWSSFSS